jgi:antitoxin ParD1/3/4
MLPWQSRIVEKLYFITTNFVICAPVMIVDGKACHNDCRETKIPKLMTTINISLPDSMRPYVDQQVANGGYSSASEYFRELVRQDQKQKENERLEAMLLEGLNSGTATAMTDQDWEDVRQAVGERITKGKEQHQG